MAAFLILIGRKILSLFYSLEPEPKTEITWQTDDFKTVTRTKIIPTTEGYNCVTTKFFIYNDIPPKIREKLESNGGLYQEKI